MRDSRDDDTIRMTPPPAAAAALPARRPGWRPGGLAALAIGLIGAIWIGVQWTGLTERPAVPGPLSSPAQEAPPPPAPVFPAMDREAVLRWQPAETTIVRLADLPGVFLIAFPDLARQGRAMNRIAAFVEKALAPRDRLLDDTALAAAIAAEGQTAETYYYGHDYALAEMERFFALARASGIALNAEERWLEAQMPALGAGARTAPRAVITIPAEAGSFDASARRAVLEHEAGHGLFFTDPAFAAQVTRAWREVFTEAERDAFRRFLKAEGYDTSLEWLMANEAMAYLVFTPDTRFFDPARDLGLDPAAAERLRAAMRPAPRR
ncbi:hypothetical protein [Roseomonas indoligenes]|uniref:Uncharacterized protein n=1 Tax=Roseomonas indoligenes TaxID=2820811 RepID=A0A940MU71_9PROT|nr:hypothetical protein [Pararoseomonas indoligenes]MBP0491768.1 hypothetical protein [Pararoseomonas indoligenes]